MISENLKILMFGWEFSPLIAGGLGVVCRDISKSLTGINNTHITYVLPRIPENTDFALSGVRFKNADLDNVEIKVIESVMGSPYAGVDSKFKESDLINLQLKNVKYQQKVSKKSTNKGKQKKEIYNINLLKEVDAYADRAEKLAQDEDFDIVHNHDWMTAPAAVKVKERTGKPMIMHVHATEVDRTLGNPNPQIYEKEVFGMQNADKIIAVSNRTKDKIVKNYGIDPKKVEVVHNAIEQVESKYGPIAKSIYKDDKIVLFLARLTAMKGANYLLEAAPKVLKHLPKTKFVFVGRGELMEELIEMSVELGISHKVTFTGFLPHDQVDRAYSSAHAFVMPSVAEPFGITPLEAIKNGTPVIISKQSGVSEVLQNVLKVDFWDVDEMANKLIAILKYGVLAEELVNNSKKDLQRLTWNRQTKQIFDIYQELTDNKF